MSDGRVPFHFLRPSFFSEALLATSRLSKVACREEFISVEPAVSYGNKCRKLVLKKAIFR